jgi:hypothetical protein
MHPRAKSCVPANNNVYTDTDGYQLPNFATFFCTGLMVPFIILLRELIMPYPLYLVGYVLI